MKIAILGIGAIGSYVAAKLSQLDSVELFLLARSNFSEIKENGIVLTKERSIENSTSRQFSIYQDINELPKCDVIIICVQSSQTPEVLKHIECLCHLDTRVITLQNGLNFELAIEHALPQNTPLYSGTCWIKISTLSKNHIRHDFGTLIKLGQYSGKNNNLKNIAELFHTAGLTIEVVNNIHAVQLTKLALNVPFFTLAAISGKSVTEILYDAELDKKRNILQNEIIDAASALNATVDVVLIEKIITDLRKMQPVSPANRKAFIERMKAELPQSTGELLNFFKLHNMTLHELSELFMKINAEKAH